MAQRQDGDAWAQANFRSPRGRGGEKYGRVGDEPAVTEKVMLVEHETFPAQFLGKLDLLENLTVINVVARIDIRKVRRQYVDVKTHAMFTRRCLRVYIA